MPKPLLCLMAATAVAGANGPAAAQTDPTMEAMRCLSASAAMRQGESDPMIVNNLESLDAFFMGRLAGQHSPLDGGTLATFAISYQTERDEAAAAVTAFKEKSKTAEAESLEASVEPGVSQCLAAMGQAIGLVTGEK